jgi:hypothetical protein
LERSLTLQEELIRLREEEWRRESRSNLRRVGIGLSAFLAFWFIGAVIFHLIEVSPHRQTNLSRGATAMLSTFVMFSF